MQTDTNPTTGQGRYTRVNNTIFDQLLPTLSGSALKVLLIALRQTAGWADPSSPTGRKLCDQISYSQFRAKSGIASRTTLSRAIQECLAAGVLVRRRNGSGFLYSLNAAFESNGPETVPSTSPETVPPIVQNLDTQKETSNQIGSEGGESSVLGLLRDFGMNLDGEVRALASRYSHPQVQYAIHRARQGATRNPQGLLRHWMKSGVMPSPPRAVSGGSARYSVPPSRSRDDRPAGTADQGDTDDAFEPHAPPPPAPPPSEAQLLWGQALDDLSLQMARDTFNHWLKPTRCIGLVNDTLSVAMDDHYRQEWLENRLRSTIQRTVDHLAGRELPIEFVVHPPASQGPAPNHRLEL